MIRAFYLLACVAAIWAASGFAVAEEFRFPMPEFESNYQHPAMHTPPPARTEGLVDVAVLFVALSVSAWLVLRRRSRAGIFLVSVFSVLYFGFWRKGCVCSVGALQNVTEALMDPGVGVPAAVLAFFLLPLLFALLFGRVFCAGVCPLGALQEIVAVRPVTVPMPVERVLRLVPYVYLGLTVLAVSTGAGYLICRYDPFVGFFRQGARFNMLIAGGILLGAGVFIGRPYCRYLCPYGVLLGWLSRSSRWHASITPKECIQCKLCEDSCPYGAINEPTPAEAPVARRKGARRLGLLIAIAPVIIAVGALTGWILHPSLARLHATVRLADRVAAEEQGRFQDRTLESEALRSSKKTIAELYEEARGVERGFGPKSAAFGAFVGAVVAVHLIGLSLFRKRADYETDRGACVSCARCFAYCPIERNDDTA